VNHIKAWIKIFSIFILSAFFGTQLHAVTFDWQTEGGGWTAGALSKNYTNVAGSGIDVNVSIVGSTGEFLSGYPATDANGLNLQVDYTNKNNSVTLIMKFSEPVKLSSLKLKDFDTGTYVDRALVSGIDTAGNVVYPSSATLGSGVHQNASGDYEANAGTSVSPTDASGQVDASFTDVAITELRWTYNNGTSANTDPAGQFLWIDPVIFAKSSPQLSIVKTSSAGGGPVLPGQTITYTIVVTNDAATTGDARGVTLSDILPTGATYTAASAQKTYFTAGAPVTNNYTNNTSIAVPDNACPTETSRIINVPDSFTITDINIGFNMTHTWKGDMNVFVTSPQGTKVQLLNQVGGANNGNDNFDILFDSDSGNTNASLGGNHNTAAPLYDNVGQPLNSLNAFDGENTSGDWHISFCDAADQDTGTFNSARLDITGTTRTTTTDNANAPENMVTSDDNITLKPGETLTVTYDVTVNGTSADLNNTATASADEMTGSVSDWANDLLNDADLSVVKTLLTPPPFVPGQSISYSIVVSNAGLGTATDINVTDLPTNLKVISATGPSSSCTITDPSPAVTTSVVCNITSLAADANETITLTATVP